MLNQNEFRNAKYAKALSNEIRRLNDGRQTRIVHVCGTHEHTISHSGIRSLLPREIDLVAGPGCPVCVSAAEDIDMAIELVRKGHIIVSFGDMIRVPSTSSSLGKERERGGDIRVVYGPNEAVEIARKNPDKEIVFVGVGFETTAPAMAVEMLKGPPENFSILTSLKLVPPAMEILMNQDGFSVNGFITPGHVSVIIGTNAYGPIAEKYKVPCVAAGFEPLDVLESIRMILLQIEEGRTESENEYTRVVRPEGNLAAQKVLEDAFRIDAAPWRGLGVIGNSGYFPRAELAAYDAREKFEFPPLDSVDILPGCICHKIVIGIADPKECPLFGKRCVPENPYGPCMVGYEGTCRIRHESTFD